MKTTTISPGVLPGFNEPQKCYFQLPPADLVKLALLKNEGTTSSSGALVINTGIFTGRSPKDRYIVHDELSSGPVNWGEINIPFEENAFDRLHRKMTAYLSGKAFFVRNAFAGYNEDSRISLRIITEQASQDLFAYNLFIRPEQSQHVEPEWTVIAAPGFRADPAVEQTRQPNFSIISFSRKTILIGGTAYTGEIKKAVFSVLNFLLPQKGILPMHCAANRGKNGDAAIFFGLSGTGKTTLSADPARMLIGDDEHGWDDSSVFNFEGGCYAKTVNLCKENEPQIYRAIRQGSLLENTAFFPGSDKVNYRNTCKTENTRVSYPLDYIENALTPPVGPPPENIFFLTADAFGVLPPVARLTQQQAIYYFTLGYTAKVAGTEFGINEPQATFSACFGKAFMPLHPSVYARLLNDKIEKYKPSIWLINTGWCGGAYGTGSRIKLEYTRAILQAIFTGELKKARYEQLPVFNLMIPKSCPGIPASLLNPADTWADKDAYYPAAFKLAEMFTRQMDELLATIA
ncbi:phosphoenolpyruvate carboxykinase (ATP) [Pedobacter sp. HMF7647]|uniref:Phosphoenolpyruvate carboxykinase (ATP) n=1 Tax=Hufsiella arboris TaxID=2695275 RepID=A0A7K1Y5U1_9SPHI|nr:phosphoenolpyruvate carboxykinase (ATP) [Hufsiella arboris]MXV49954.1 phosphoenolpyruvate carboxykinase (ATP) [Hufsiella arboris]